MSPRDPRSKEVRDEYDGHANYRESLAPKPGRVIARGFLRGLLAVGLCVTITWVVHKLLYPGPNILLLFTAGFAGLLGLIGGALGYSWMNKDRAGEHKELGFLDTIVVLIFVIAYLVPLSMERANEKRERRARAAEQNEQARAYQEAVVIREEVAAAELRTEEREKESFERRAGASRRRVAPSPGYGAPENAETAENATVNAPNVAASASTPEIPAAEPIRTAGILRCRDASGAIQYTQGYCPPGTVEVSAPTRD
jgi:hypothetical protein